jgi:hypothetical protein
MVRRTVFRVGFTAITETGPAGLAEARLASGLR